MQVSDSSYGSTTRLSLNNCNNNNCNNNNCNNTREKKISILFSYSAFVSDHVLREMIKVSSKQSHEWVYRTHSEADRRMVPKTRRKQM